MRGMVRCGMTQSGIICALKNPPHQSNRPHAITQRVQNAAWLRDLAMPLKLINPAPGIVGLSVKQQLWRYANNFWSMEAPWQIVAGNLR